MGNKQPDWTSFERKVVINRGLSDVYEQWVVPNNLLKWFLKEADFFKPDKSLRDPETYIKKGDLYIWQWHRHEDIEKGEVLEANGIDRIRFSFLDSAVDVRFKANNGSTDIFLVQSGIKTDEESKMRVYNGCSIGWTYWFLVLKAYMEHGVMLHE
jgi:Activator of Hsp90 ATPase homolog 1-like protein